MHIEFQNSPATSPEHHELARHNRRVDWGLANGPALGGDNPIFLSGRENGIDIAAFNELFAFRPRQQRSIRRLFDQTNIRASHPAQ